MTTLCDYAHPETYDTSALERQGVGRMFPYHPPMYEKASDLYGPGSLLAWFLLITSFTLTSTFWPVTTVNRSDKDEQHKCRRPRVTADLLAIALYPIFAATDVLIQAVSLIGLEDRAAVILCLRFPNLKRRPDPPGEYVDPSTLPQLPVELPLDLLDYGQKIVSISGPLPVCYIALVVMAAWFFAWREYRPARNVVLRHDPETAVWEPSLGVARLVLVTTAYVALCLAVFHLSLADPLTSGLLASLELFWPLWIAAVCAAIIGALVLVGVMLWLLVHTVVWHACGITLGSAIIGRGQRPLDAGDLCGFLCAALAALWSLTCLLGTAFLLSEITLLTDLGKPLTERGQLASLLVGVATAAFSLYDVFRNEGMRWWRRRMIARGGVELSDLLAQVDRND